MQTRREIIKGGLGLAAILAARKSPAIITKSLIAARSALTGGKKLPYDAEVEWLETDGGQYVSTGIMCVSDIVINLTFTSYLTGGTSENAFTVFGDRYATGITHDYITFKGPGNRWVGYGYIRANVYTNLIVDFANRVVTQNGVIRYDGSSTPVEPYETTYNALLLRWTSNGGFIERGLVGKFYSCRLYRSSTLLVRDFIPVRFTNELGQSEGAMYDRVSGQLFRNQGTGAFVIGPVKARGASGQNGGGISG